MSKQQRPSWLFRENFGRAGTRNKFFDFSTAVLRRRQQKPERKQLTLISRISVRKQNPDFQLLHQSGSSINKGWAGNEQDEKHASKQTNWTRKRGACHILCHSTQQIIFQCSIRCFESSFALRSALSSDLMVPRTICSTIGERSFQSAAGSTWNALSHSVRSSTSVLQSRSRLKTELFARLYQQSYWICLCVCDSTFLFRDLEVFGFTSC